MRFRANDQFCAQVWDSGRVVIYDNVTGMVLGEYVPESHLQCAANCVRWEGNNLLILGGHDGTVIIFDALETKVKAYLKKVHAGAVENLLVISERVLSCGQDGAIHEYQLIQQIRLQWEQASESRPLYSLAAVNGGSRLLAASISQLRMFDVDKRTLLKTVTTQHVSPIRFLLTTEDSKVLSCADRHLVIWSKKLRCKSTLVISPSEVISLQSSDKWLCAVCSAGECVVWTRNPEGGDNSEHEWKRKITIQVATTDATPVQIHEARVINCQLLLVYGPSGRPRIEIVPLPVRNHVLIRDVTSKPIPTSTDFAGVPVTHYKPSAPKIIGPLNERAQNTAKSAPNYEDRDEVPLEERLLDGGSDSGKGEELDDQPLLNPRTDNMVHLLLQGLQSSDRTMLNAVIFRHDLEVVNNTVKKLPVDAIQLFIKELENRLHCRPGFVAPALRWTRFLLLHHSSYLESCPQLLQPLLYVLRSRLTCTDRVVEIKSTLNSLLTTTRYQSQVVTDAEITVVEEDDIASPLDLEEANSAGEASSPDEGHDELEIMEVEA
ncbi:uncharacterized protein LOC111269299 [Varroa jacobsoni]|uniref:uncharacterized protein LOC111269299 n=1 Tax=Varroa jacobsoni TaxID=62625 RepID=UPI000BFA45EC|nr:uncharacterized protein LOC111269299 [Varroa jacobsoni]